jgi:hypothetical protein
LGAEAIAYCYSIAENQLEEYRQKEFEDNRANKQEATTTRTKRKTRKSKYF